MEMLLLPSTVLFFTTTGQMICYKYILLYYWQFLEYEQWTLYGTYVVTLAMLLCLINYHFIIIIIINCLLAEYSNSESVF